MNRLWVRLSLMIAGVLFFVFFLQFLSIMTSPDFGPPPGVTDQPGAGQPPDDGGPIAGRSRRNRAAAWSTSCCSRSWWGWGPAS